MNHMFIGQWELDIELNCIQQTTNIYKVNS